MSMATGGQRNVEVRAPDIPTVGITLGDSSGIGPEVLAKTTCVPVDIAGRCRVVAYGAR